MPSSAQCVGPVVAADDELQEHSTNSAKKTTNAHRPESGVLSIDAMNLETVEKAAETLLHTSDSKQATPALKIQAIRTYCK